MMTFPSVFFLLRQRFLNVLASAKSLFKRAIWGWIFVGFRVTYVACRLIYYGFGGMIYSARFNGTLWARMFPTDLVYDLPQTRFVSG